MLNHHFIICTYNRPRELFVCLKMLMNQECLPASINIVYTTEDDIGLEAHQALENLTDNGVRVQFLLSDRGLTIQRNVAIKNIPFETDISTFIDDDIILPPNYIVKIDEFFSKNISCIGVGGITSDNPQEARFSKIRRIFFLESKYPGKVLRSGINTPFKFSTIPYEVEWLPGCCMSFRKDVFEKISFDTRRVKVGWGEDVDFSLKASAYGKLFALYIPGIVHTQSRRNRSSNLERVIQNDISRLLFAKDKLGDVQVPFIYFSLIGEILIKIHIFNQFAKLFELYINRIYMNIAKRLIILVNALKTAFQFNKKSRTVSPLILVIRNITSQFAEGKKRILELNRNAKVVKNLEN